MYYLESGAESSARMRKAILAACVIHVALAAAISFEFTTADGFQRQIEVTLATRPSELAPEQARHIAASDQMGSGSETPEALMTSQRTDLLPVYSFNGNGLWLAKSRAGNDKHVGHSSRLGPWRDVIARISDEYTR